jgi:hypothetical protein
VILSLIVALFITFLVCRHRAIRKDYAKALERELGLEGWISQQRREKEQRERELEDESWSDK